MTTSKLQTPVSLTVPNWKAAISGVVGAVISWLLTQWTKIDVGYVALFIVPISYAYHWLVITGEKKFPWLSWLLLSLPQTLPTKAAKRPSGK